MVHNGGVAFDNAVHGEVATVSGVGNLSVLENLYCQLDGINSGASIPKDEHRNLGGTTSGQ
jgi:hypothetical protein